MDECVNCCAPLNVNTKVVGIKLINPLTTTTDACPALDLTVTTALNFIYQVSGRQIYLSNDTGPGPLSHLGLCLPCWNIVSQLYRLHGDLNALTKVNSLLNKAFKVLSPAVVINSSSTFAKATGNPATGDATNVMQMPHLVQSEKQNSQPKSDSCVDNAQKLMNQTTSVSKTVALQGAKRAIQIPIPIRSNTPTTKPEILSPPGPDLRAQVIDSLQILKNILMSKTIKDSTTVTPYAKPSTKNQIRPPISAPNPKTTPTPGTRGVIPVNTSAPLFSDEDDVLKLDDNLVSIHESKTITSVTRCAELSSNPLTSNDECVNCCTPVNGGTKVVGLNLWTKGGTSPVRIITPTSALNFIYKVSGKEMPISSLNSDGSPKFKLGLCFTCWNVGFQLFLLHEKLTALTHLDSIVNKTFQVLDEISNSNNNTVIHRKTVLPDGDGLQLVNTSSSILNSLTVTEDERVQNPDEEETAYFKLENPDSIKFEVAEGVEEIFGNDPYPYGDPLASPEPEGSYLETEHVMEEIIVKCEPILSESDEINETSDQGSENVDMDADSPYDPLNPDPPPHNPDLEPVHPLSLNEFRDSMKPQNLSYSGPCSVFGCSHVFKSVTQFHVREHFCDVHRQAVEFRKECHLCGEALVSDGMLFLEHLKGRTHEKSFPQKVSLETLTKDFNEFNENILRTRCGLRLTRDGIAIPGVPVPGSLKWHCRECGAAFKYQSVLKCHVKSRHLRQCSRKPFRCPEPNCTYSGCRRAALMQHKKTKHPAEKSHNCVPCGTRYETKEYLEFHYSEFH